MNLIEYLKNKVPPTKIRAIISLPNDKVIECEVDECQTFNGGLIKILSGNVTYTTHINNVVIIEEEPK